MRSYRKILFIAIFFAGFAGTIKAQYLDLDILKSINPRHPGSDYWKATSASVYYFAAGASVGTLAAGYISKD